VKAGDYGGNYIYYGVREHGMGSIMNGIAAHGGLIPFGGTFLVFSDYMRPAVRMAAMMKLNVIYVFTHDSIGLGEDGPTHQPVEHLASLRAIPGLTLIRPADGGETIEAWKSALTRRQGPTALVLTRQNLPQLDRAKSNKAANGAYVLAGPEDAQVILMASGSEVSIALDAGSILEKEGISARVVSMPSWEIFAAMPKEYQEQVLPERIQARVAVEAGSPMGWERFTGPHGAVIALDHFGASAPYETLYEKFGLTAQAVASAAAKLVK
ncbi:MAG: transketolase, partial [Anaerolineae bacterium]|nr:transketolase [Anaerolineae bacterium]